MGRAAAMDEKGRWRKRLPVTLGDFLPLALLGVPSLATRRLLVCWRGGAFRCSTARTQWATSFPTPTILISRDFSALVYKTLDGDGMMALDSTGTAFELIKLNPVPGLTPTR